MLLFLSRPIWLLFSLSYFSTLLLIKKIQWHLPISVQKYFKCLFKSWIKLTLTTFVVAFYLFIVFYESRFLIKFNQLSFSCSVIDQKISRFGNTNHSDLSASIPEKTQFPNPASHSFQWIIFPYKIFSWFPEIPTPFSAETQTVLCLLTQLFTNAYLNPTLQRRWWACESILPSDLNSTTKWFLCSLHIFPTLQPTCITKVLNDMIESRDPFLGSCYVSISESQRKQETCHCHIDHLSTEIWKCHFQLALLMARQTLILRSFARMFNSGNSFGRNWAPTFSRHVVIMNRRHRGARGCTIVPDTNERNGGGGPTLYMPSLS